MPHLLQNVVLEVTEGVREFHISEYQAHEP